MDPSGAKIYQPSTAISPVQVLGGLLLGLHQGHQLYNVLGEEPTLEEPQMCGGAGRNGLEQLDVGFLALNKTKEKQQRLVLVFFPTIWMNLEEFQTEVTSQCL